MNFLERIVRIERGPVDVEGSLQRYLAEEDQARQQYADFLEEIRTNFSGGLIRKASDAEDAQWKIRSDRIAENSQERLILFDRTVLTAKP